MTHVLEAFTGEPVEVVKLSQVLGPGGASTPALALAEGDTVVRRSVLLRSRWSGRGLVHGESVVACDRVPLEVRAGLLATSKGIGSLLFESKIETFREILSWGQENAGPVATPLGLEPEDPVLFRNYRIMSGGRPIMLITERFGTATLIGDGRRSARGAGTAARP